MSALLKQKAFDFSEPADHALAIHTGTRHGTVLFWERAVNHKGRWTKCRPHDDMPGFARALQGAIDAFISINEFNGWRLVSLLSSLRAVYIDIDGQTDLDLVLDALLVAKMPPPSLVVFSGRGIHLYWLLKPTPAKALPTWQRIQDALLKSLKEIGADPSCRDCTRVLRLAGTVNSKNGSETRGLILTGTEWDLHSLSNEVLGARPSRPKAAVRDFTAAHARAGRKGVLAGSIYGWWYTVYSDLVRLTSLEYGNQLPEGKRDKILFLHAVSLSWFAQPEAIENEILAVGRRLTDFTDAEIRSTMAPVIERRNLADAGHKITWEGQERDPRYFFTAERLREWVGEDLIRKHAGQLRALAPAEVIKERKQERDKARWSDHYTGLGARVSNEEKRATARLMKAQNAKRSQSEIALELGVSQKTVSLWLR